MPILSWCNAEESATLARTFLQGAWLLPLADHRVEIHHHRHLNSEVHDAEPLSFHFGSKAGVRCQMPENL